MTQTAGVSTTRTTLAELVKPGHAVLITLSRPVLCTVAAVEWTGSYRMGSLTDRILRFTFSDAPKVIKALEIPESQAVEVSCA